LASTQIQVQIKHILLLWTL